MKAFNEYLRIGTQYYKKVKFTLPSGIDTVEMMVKWNKDTIIDDFGKNALSKIPKYDYSYPIPNHIDYQQQLGSIYNSYHPLDHQPRSGDCKNTLNFIKHIFGDQYELGLDYLALLYLKPTQILPVLCVISAERGTGKTTLLNWLKAIFGLNATLNKNEDFRSRFNSDWANKLLILVDETLLDKKEDSERIKNLSTAKHYKSEAKGIDKQEVPFFGKFILCSNNEENFIYTDDNEIRFWVRKLKKLENEDLFLLDKLIKEIPAFLHFLKERGIKSESKSRMWFSPEQIWTEALQKLIEGNRSTIEREMKEFIKDYILDHDLPEARFTNKDLLEILKWMGFRVVKRTDLSNILQNKWGLSPVQNASTYKYYLDDEYEGSHPIDKKGRYYTFKRDEFVASSSNKSKPKRSSTVSLVA